MSSKVLVRWLCLAATLLPLLCAARDSLLVVPLPDGQQVEMVWVEGGIFTMGSNRPNGGVAHAYEHTRPEHRVEVSSFYMSRFEVTQGMWRAVMGENPSKFSGNDSLPVEQVSWSMAQQFVTLLSQLTGRRFRLPTEAEWEYAARGGKVGHGMPFAGATRSNFGNYGWFCTNSERHTHAVGTMLPNELGLYDMCGNVAEWCSDWYAPYSAADQTNPTGATAGENRVLRGGHYNCTSSECTVYDRSWYVPDAATEYFGLRLVLEQ